MIQGKQRLFAIILLSSLALNIFLGGILVGKHLGNISGQQFDHPPPPKKKGFRSKQEWFHWMVQTLPEESREKVLPLVQKYSADSKHQIRQVKKARRAVNEQLRASDFKVEAFSKALAVLGQERDKVRKMINTVLMEIASQLDEEGRHRLVEAMRKPRPPKQRNHPKDADTEKE
ncbi:periplasmic heavy metal sensor [Candidatus Parabeggiatoa sp. HSG14]|uniref:periplasmic heavy metal sensor n=1 Tax=Candidatus Parabeggiatoa sp. HSG14 TaxID=3055593 RepID=UPI0025A6ABF4|nr:periplasmic heavy metal sensor [Thiotrichales bacterium HSG14]